MASNDIQVKLTLTGLQQFQKGLKQVTADSKKFGTSLRDVGDSAVKFGQNLAKGAAVAGAAIAAVTARFSEFEREFTNVVTLLDDSSFTTGTLTQGIAGLEQGIISLRAESGETFDNLNKGLFDLISSGVAAADAIEVLGVATELALAGGTDTAIAVDGITTAINAFGKEAGTAEDIAQKFFTAQKFGKTTIEELSKSVGLVASTASASGLSFDELLASVSAATTTGVRTNAAFTGLRGAISNVLRPTAAAAQEAERLGIQFDGTALRSQGLIGLLDRVTSSSNFNADSFTRLFGSIEALNFVQAVSARNFSAVNSITNALGSATQRASTFNAALAVNQDTVSFASNRLLGQFDALAVQIGQTLAPAIKDIITLLGDLVEEFGPAVISFFEDVGQKVEAFVRQFGGANLGQTVAIITDAFIKLKDAAVAFFDILSAILTRIAALFEIAGPEIEKLSRKLDDLARFFKLADGETLLLTAAILQLTGLLPLLVSLLTASILGFNLFKNIIKLVATTIVGSLIPAILAFIATPLGLFLTAIIALLGTVIVKFTDWENVITEIGRVFNTAKIIILNVLSLVALSVLKVIQVLKDMGAVVALVFGRKTIDEATDAINKNREAFEKSGAALAGFSNNVTASLTPLQQQQQQLEQNTQSAEELREFLNRPFTPIVPLENVQFGPQRGGAGAAFFADGGMLHGPGTTTSDSIPLWGSDGEFMMRAKAVKTFGTNFMHMINRGILPKFADGGLISATTSGFSPIPSAVVAGAGPNKALRPVNLTIPGVGTFPFFDEKSTAENMQAALRKSNSNKSAKLPIWYR